MKLWHITSPTGEVKNIILLVAMEKDDMQDDHQYADRFVSGDLFEWQSQNSSSRASGKGKQLGDHVALGLDVHLFIRKTKKQGGTAAPFTYFGPVEFVSWEGDKPITVRWRLKERVSGKLLEGFG